MTESTEHPADPELVALIRSLRGTARTRVFAVTYNSRRLWVKTAGPPRLRSSVLMQRIIATVFGLPILLPARNQTGALGLAAEAAAIRELAQAGFPVPAVVACSGQWLGLSDAGEALDRHDVFIALSKPLRPSELFDALALLAAENPPSQAVPRT